jgi:hypothetical protein
MKMIEKLVINLVKKEEIERKTKEITKLRLEEVGHLQEVPKKITIEGTDRDHQDILVLALNLIDIDKDQEKSEPGNNQEINIMIEIIDIEMNQGHGNIEEIGNTLKILQNIESDRKKD